MTQIVLASQSPRRKELLEKAGIDFIVDASFIDEILDDSLPLLKRLEKLALDKGMDVFIRHQDDLVISADTTVYHDGQIIGKPADEDEAKAILMSLSDNTHSVFTSVAIITKDHTISFVDETKVTFHKLSELELNAYLASKEWDGKAGAYGIQGMAGDFVSALDGDFDNVVGLPVNHLKMILKLMDQK